MSRQRIARLHRLERLRDAHCRTAMLAAAEAEARRAELAALAARTEALVGDYAAAHGEDAGALARRALFAAGIGRIAAATAADLARAAAQADLAAAALTAAERRRGVVADRRAEAEAGLGAVLARLLNS